MGVTPFSAAVSRAANVVFAGETAVGKTGLATGILIKALENGYRLEKWGSSPFPQPRIRRGSDAPSTRHNLLVELPLD